MKANGFGHVESLPRDWNVLLRVESDSLCQCESHPRDASVHFVRIARPCNAAQVRAMETASLRRNRDTPTTKKTAAFAWSSLPTNIQFSAYRNRSNHSFCNHPQDAFEDHREIVSPVFLSKCIPKHFRNQPTGLVLRRLPNVVEMPSWVRGQRPQRCTVRDSELCAPDCDSFAATGLHVQTHSADFDMSNPTFLAKMGQILNFCEYRSRLHN